MNTMTPEQHVITSTHFSDLFNRTTQHRVPDLLTICPSPFPLPFYFNCFGGKWNGHMMEWKEDCLQLRITGFPPIEISQSVLLQYFIHGQDLPLHEYRCLIQDVHVESGSSAWQGTTDIRLSFHACNDGPGTSHNTFEGLPPVRGGNFLVGQVLESSICPSLNVENLVHHTPTLQSSLRQSEKDVRQLELPARKASICSTRLTIEKTNGQRIRAYHDHPVEEVPAELPIVVIAPGYGETKRDYLTLAYYFVSNGFQVVRYDHTNHVGESDGRHYNVTLSSLKDDFQTVTRFVKATWPHSTLIGVASSLASRVALKAEAECPSVSLMIMLMGIVNVQRSAATVHQEDVFAGYDVGNGPDSANILGFNVGKQFLSDAVTNKFVTLEHTLNDAKSLVAPVIVVSAGKDAWVAPEDLQAFRKALGRRIEDWIVVPEALHRLQENPKIARETYRQLVAHCLMRVKMSPSHGVIYNPNRLDLGRQNREEKIVLQQQASTKVGTGFWQDYLGHFQSVGTCRDYVKLLDHVFHALGPVLPGHTFLDAGCGNGNAGLFFLKSLQSGTAGVSPLLDGSIQYVGIDVVPEALRRAHNTMVSAITEIQPDNSSSHPLLKMSWAQVDLGHPLPFPDNQFDRIVSNLVLGYVPDPLVALKELYRVLAPNGRMVLSNLKPNGDFSGIYESLVRTAAFPTQREEARDLLNNYGKIRQAEKEGQFCFFDRTQWESVVATLGCAHAAVYPTFAGQAFLVVLEKPQVGTRVPLPFIENKAQRQPLDTVTGVLKQVA